MTDSSDGKRAEAAPQAGVLGNLPRTRPSVRSPKRAAPAPETAAESVTPPAEPEPAAGESGSPADLEALARTGAAIAGGAATLGLRIAGRAAAAVRGAVERR